MPERTRRLPKLLSEPMWVLGLVVLVDEIDKNIVRGLIDPLKDEFGVGDFAIGVLLSMQLLFNGVITVPAQTWKVVLILPKASGEDVARVTAQTCTLAVLMPNTQGIRTNDPNDWMQYITTVDNRGDDAQ